VLTIGASFPDLRELHLAGNGIRDLRPALSDQTVPCFGSLQVRHSAAHMTCFTCRSWSDSEWDSAALSWLLPSPVTFVQVLDLDQNQLSDWAEVQTLSQLPSLQRLSLTGNSIADICSTAAGRVLGLLLCTCRF